MNLQAGTYGRAPTARLCVQAGVRPVPGAVQDAVAPDLAPLAGRLSRRGHGATQGTPHLGQRVRLREDQNFHQDQ